MTTTPITDIPDYKRIWKTIHSHTSRVTVIYQFMGFKGGAGANSIDDLSELMVNRFSKETRFKYEVPEDSVPIRLNKTENGPEVIITRNLSLDDQLELEESLVRETDNVVINIID